MIFFLLNEIYENNSVTFSLNTYTPIYSCATRMQDASG